MFNSSSLLCVPQCTWLGGSQPILVFSAFHSSAPCSQPPTLIPHPLFCWPLYSEVRISHDCSHTFPFYPDSPPHRTLLVSGLEPKIYNYHQVSIHVRSHWPPYTEEHYYQVSFSFPSIPTSYFQDPSLIPHPLLEFLVIFTMKSSSVSNQIINPLQQRKVSFFLLLMYLPTGFVPS